VIQTTLEERVRNGHVNYSCVFGVPAFIDAAAGRQVAHGGPVEYVAAALLVLQILMARSCLGKWRANWSRPALVGVLASLILLWSATACGIWLTSSGSLYSSGIMTVALRTGIVAVGYFWILLSSLAVALGVAARFLIGKIPGSHSPARRQWLRAAGIAAIGAPAAVVAFGVLVERKQYRVLELDLPVAGLHPDLEGFRIVQVSDLHVSPFLSSREAGRVIDMANELRADLAVFTGDLISEIGDPLNEAIRELIRLRGDAGVLGCMGNHEGYTGCRNYLQRQAGKAGLIFLRGNATQIRRGQAILNVAGVDYQRNGDRANYLPGAETLVVPQASNLLLSHNPDVFPAAIQRGFQVVLSGHTHGGQVNVEILHQNINPARFRTPFVSGLYRLGSPGGTAASCFVTNGIGTIGMPLRLGAPPEIALLRLRRA
jgi:hypothetical protein